MILPENKEIYDENWARWEDIKRYGPMSRHTQRLVLGECKKLKFDSILDVGCGPGVFLQLIKSRYPECSISGTDISSTAVSLAKTKFAGSEFHEIDISSRIPPGKWDLVTMIDVAEHIENDSGAFKNIRSICQKYLLIVTLEGRMRGFERQIGHVRNYQSNELCTKLQNAGFSIMRYIHWGWPLYSPIYRNMSAGIDAHHKPVTMIKRIVSRLVYLLLYCNLPGKGDLIIVVARPNG